jgi:nucleoside-diphosphate-sugar epimerase
MITIIGRHGFIGSALAKRFKRVNSYPTKKTKILFHFGSTVHPPFDQNPDYHMSQIITSFLQLLPFCRDNNIFFVYPSSALTYEKDTTFSKCKKILEMLASCYPNTLGLRIFPVYGGQEKRTVIAKWCREMKKGKRPVVYGDGTQTRSFIHIDDVVDQILKLVKDKKTGIADIGSERVATSFNGIIKIINNYLCRQEDKYIDLNPIYAEQPKNYPEGIDCPNPGKTKVSLKEGIKRICQEI